MAAKKKTPGPPQPSGAPKPPVGGPKKYQKSKDVRRRSRTAPYQTCAGCDGPITNIKGFRASNARGFCGHCEKAARIFQRSTKIKVGPIAHQQMAGEFSSHNLEIDPVEMRNVAESHASEIANIRSVLSSYGDTLKTGQVENGPQSMRIQTSHLEHWARLHPVLAAKSVEEHESKTADVKRARLDRQNARDREQRAVDRTEKAEETLKAAGGIVGVTLSKRQIRDLKKRTGGAETIDLTPRGRQGGRPRGSGDGSSVEKTARRGVDVYTATSGGRARTTSESPVSVADRYPRVIEAAAAAPRLPRNAVHTLKVNDVVHSERDGFGLVVGHQSPPLKSGDAKDEKSMQERRQRVYIYHPHLPTTIPYELDADTYHNIPGVALATAPEADESKVTPYALITRNTSKTGEVSKIEKELRSKLEAHLSSM